MRGERDDELTDIVYQNRRLLRGENGMVGLSDRMTRMENAVQDINATIESGKTVAKTLIGIVAFVGIANIIVLVTLMARAAQL